MTKVALAIDPLKKMVISSKRELERDATLSKEHECELFAVRVKH